MRKFIKALTIMLLLTLSLSVKVQAESLITINDLIENAKALDGQEVVIQGEIIGESMNRGDYSWINMNDTTNAIGIWLKKSDADRIVHYGNYKNIGDTVKIKGTFYRACKEHGGELDVHCNSLEIMEDGHQVKEQILVTKITVCFLLISTALMLLICLKNKIRTKSLS